MIAAARRVPAAALVRWALLAGTLLGLAAMHTIGHRGPGGHMGDPGATGHPGARPAAAIMTAMAQPVPIAAAGLATDAVCPDGHCDGHHPMSGWNACQAVLQVVTAAVLLALLLLVAGRGSGGVRATVPRRAWPPRGPPGPGWGLTIASVAALRI
ncbi:hypothetical protein [Actinoplanes teichomyceticus]|uniref:Uncharacterized protein n=1 Tax=Actinoplanes teichomyceticus TaxID=1867 RepID=A0A561VI57_ACTTI|nr:hypothetical protein [Actinoplanes teichomyceticus]TWG11302.1 hypothetical protein FHX34_10632 [Actinoplanes teichomyceticus]GIF16333.1 hypothetical protein Ate01nite_63650 [Actinoplanes teichomyceticus]